MVRVVSGPDAAGSLLWSKFPRSEGEGAAADVKLHDDFKT
jgi:hypothetical protein